MTTLSTASTQKSTSGKNWNRATEANKIADYSKQSAETSQRQWSNNQSVPRTTLQYWLKRKISINSSPFLIDFFESPDGLAFLHLLVAALHFVFTKVGVASSRNVSEFLELTGLSAFAASSATTQKRVSRSMDKAIIQFAEKERERLAARMPKKRIGVCEDETFHPEICLVAMEPVSNYILVEKYAENRKAETWNRSLDEGLKGLPVTVFQSSGDEGSGLLRHAEKGLKVHHSPDLFHVVYEISKGTSGALSSAVRHAEKAVLKACELVRQTVEKKEAAQAKNPGALKKYFELFDKTIELARRKQKEASITFKEALSNQDRVREARKKISRVYHPYDLESGQKREGSEVETLLNQCFSEIRQGAANLSDRCRKRIDKAFRVVSKMKATIAFFFCSLKLAVCEMGLEPEIERLFLDRWVPGFYLRQVAGKSKDKEEKKRLEARSAQLLSSLRGRCGPTDKLDREELRRLEKSALECACMFQRSSSCVEGRNAQLSLRHHSLHRLSSDRLKALTAVHNHHIKREDGTTAAERFFEQKHQDMFKWILDHMDLPARPRKRKPKPLKAA